MLKKEEGICSLRTIILTKGGEKGPVTIANLSWGMKCAVVVIVFLSFFFFFEPVRFTQQSEENNNKLLNV